VKSRKFFKIAGGAFALAMCGIAPAVSAQQAAEQAMVDPDFQGMDQDHDGRLTRSELPKDMVLLRTRFSTYDQNHDNKLDAQEFAAAKTAMKGSGNAMGGDAPARHEPPPSH
jgi:Ca2+-binding EF-hand superfamily protein